MTISRKIVEFVNVDAVSLVRDYIIEKGLLSSTNPIESHRSLARVSQNKLLNEVDISSGQIVGLKSGKKIIF